MLTLLLADSELEMVPQALTGHLQVQQSARRLGVNPRRMLLDSSLHHAAMRTLDEGRRRGRPDLVHLFLLTCLESLLNRARQLQVLVHTRENHLIRVRPETRLQRNYNRFCGLIQQLFETGKVPLEQALLTLEKGRDLAGVVAELRPERTLLLDPQGTSQKPWEIFSPADGSRNVLGIVGGFPSGDFRSPLPSGERLSLGPELLPVWTVAAELVINYERVAPSLGEGGAGVKAA